MSKPSFEEKSIKGPASVQPVLVINRILQTRCPFSSFKMYKVFFLLILLSFWDVFSADVVTMSSTSMEPHPVYKPQDASNAYVPHMTYQDVGLQNDPYPSYPSYEDYTSYPPVSTVAAIQVNFLFNQENYSRVIRETNNMFVRYNSLNSCCSRGHLERF